MSYEVFWLEKAQENFTNTIEYIKENWGNNSANRFKEKVEKQIELISTMPKISPIAFWKRNIRRSVIVKQISLYYIEFEVEQEIVIIRLLDNRMDLSYIAEELDSIDIEE